MQNNRVLAVLIAVIGMGLFAWPETAHASRRPLDLPVGDCRSQEESDGVEVITFFGHEYEGDAFFWCLDRSYSMTGDKIEILRNEMYDAIDQLSSGSEFGIVSFSFDVGMLHYRPLRATHANKKRARHYVRNLRASGNTDLALGMSRTLHLCNRSKKPNRQVILVGDGMPDSVADTLQVIATQNPRKAPINTIYVASDEGGISLFREIANMSQGSFRRLSL